MTSHFPDPTKELVIARFIRKSLEWVLAGGAIVFALCVLLLPGKALSDSETMDTMLQLGGPTIWGLMFFTLGITRMGVLIVNGWWPQSPYVRYWLSIIFLFLVWLPVSLTYILNMLTGVTTVFRPGAVSFPVLVAAEALVMLTMKTWIEILRKP